MSKIRRLPPNTASADKVTAQKADDRDACPRAWRGSAVAAQGM
jgi:hypothetical protein